MIHIVSHCWAEHLPQYATFLQFQLSSILLYPPRVPIVCEICYCGQDERTVQMLDAFAREFDKHEDLELVPLEMSREQLGRRSIGRNRAALKTGADLMWFADVDMLFRQGCLDTLWDQWLDCDRIPALWWPQHIQIQRTHALGDTAVQQAAGSPELLVDIDPEEFIPHRYTRAIGGVQIVPGIHCRKGGYLGHSERWQQPRTDGLPFGDFLDDVRFRSHMRSLGIMEAIELPELYRMRHSVTTYQ